jgi:outer membrane protein OmpA-like peptidoglycan-associated protein
MRRLRLNPENDPVPETESDFGLSIGDLMSALLMFFVLFLSVTLFNLSSSVNQAHTAEKKAKLTTQRMRSIAETYNTLQDDLYKDLKNTFEQDFKNWHATIDKETISIRFMSPDVIFEQGQSVVKPEFKAILSNFFPRYLNVLRKPKYLNHIEEIRIEGHTSSEWTEGGSKDEAYFGNMELSQNRTRSVLQYILGNIPDPKLKEWSRSHITANGLSFSKVITNTANTEDKESSRRVEFRVRTDSEKQIQKILLIDYE